MTTVALSHRPEIPESPAAFTDASLAIVAEMVNEVLERTPGARERIKDKYVLLKPNLVRPDLKRIPTTITDPRVIFATCQVLRDWGAKRIAVGDNPGYGLKAAQAFSLANLRTKLKEYGAEPCYFDEVDRVVSPNASAFCFRNILTPRPVLECDTFFNLPKLKTHMHTLVTLGLKNLQGIILDEQRLIFHRNDIHTKIVDTVRVRPPELTLIDGLWAMDGQAPFYGNPIPDFNTLLCGTDTTAVDRVSCQLMMIHPEEVTHIRLARQAGLSQAKDEDIMVVGDTIENRRRPFRRPVLSSVGVYDNVLVLEGGACLGTMSSLRHSLEKLAFEDRLKNLPGKVMVYLGEPMPNIETVENWEGDLWLFGNAAANLVFSPAQQRTRIQYIPGAPPHVHDLYKRFLAHYDL